MRPQSDQPVPPPVLAWGAATHPGRVRSDNEDAYVAEPMVFGVADGMGGHAAGEVASAIAATTLRERLQHGAASVDLMVAAVVEANAAIFQGAHTHADQRGMGTTLTAMAAMPAADGGGAAARLVVANVGDSRTYVYRAGQLRRVTVDHSYVQELVNTGHITEAEARTHPRRNIVTRALGIEPTVRVDTWVQPLVRGDRYVLCSDGLVDEVDDIEIAAVLAAHEQPTAVAEALVAAANANGGRDNVTVVVVDVLEGDLPTETEELVLAVDLEDQWEDAPDRLIDAEAGAIVADDPGAPDVRGPAAIVPSLPAAGRVRVSGPTTMELPVTAVAPPPSFRRRSPLGWFLFALAFGVIVMLTVVFVLVVQHNDDDPTPTTTTSTSTTSTSTTSTTTPRTTTTLATESTVAASTGP